MDELQERVLAELRRYAANRLKDVARGAETRELAGQPSPDLARDIEAVVLAVGREAVKHRRNRWDAAPAGLALPRRN